MLAKQIYKNIKEEKRELEKKNKRYKVKKITMFTALAIGTTAIGVTMLYKKIKLNKESCEYNQCNYRLGDIEENEDLELKSKIEEFNNNRLSYDNEEHSSNEEMNKFINKIDNQENDLNKD